MLRISYLTSVDEKNLILKRKGERDAAAPHGDPSIFFSLLLSLSLSKERWGESPQPRILRILALANICYVDAVLAELSNVNRSMGSVISRLSPYHKAPGKRCEASHVTGDSPGGESPRPWILRILALA